MSRDVQRQTSKAGQLEQLSNELHAALCPLILNQNENPLLYLCYHFRDKAGIGLSAVATAYRTLRLSTTEGKYCERNSMAAFEALAESDGHIDSQQFLQLLGMLTAGLPEPVASSLAQLFTDLGRLPPDFATFHCTTKLCMLLEELVAAQQQQTQGASSHFIQVPEAKNLLTKLLQQQSWLQAMGPQPQVQKLRAVHLTPGDTPLDVRLQNEHIARTAQRVVDMAFQLE